MRGQPVAAAVLRARELAEEVLFPAAAGVDRADSVPASHLDALAAAGLYGLVGPAEYGGLDASRADVAEVSEALASGCVTTTLVWGQHHGSVFQLSRGPNSELRERWLRPLCTGEARSGVLLAGLLPGPPRVRATPVDGGWRLDGEAPWVSGWGLVDVFGVAARTPDDEVLWFLLAADAAGMSAERAPLSALHASRTVRVVLDGVAAPLSALTGRFPYAAWPAMDAAALRTNGSLPLGLASRCCALMGESPFDAELVAVRAALDAAGPEELPAGRAAAAELAHRAAGALVVQAGSGAILSGQHPERLAREAAVLLVFASRPAIKTHLTDLLSR
jgi:alkylation response protein AidB-like acyl-CoA dehydrogenase